MKTEIAYKLIKTANDLNQPLLYRKNLITLKIASRVIEKKITSSQNAVIYEKLI